MVRRLLLFVGVVAVVAAGVVLGLGVSGAGGAVGSVQARWVIRDLGTLGKKGEESEAVAINERGQVVGSSKTGVTTTGGLTIRHAFLWQNGKMRDLGGPSSAASDINDRGQVAGSRRGVQGYRHAFLWQRGLTLDLTPIAKLSPLVCSERGYSCDIDDALVNNKGQVLVSMTSHPLDWAIDRVFLWQSGRLIDLPALGGEATWASDINDRTTRSSATAPPRPASDTPSSGR